MAADIVLLHHGRQREEAPHSTIYTHPSVIACVLPHLALAGEVGRFYAVSADTHSTHLDVSGSSGATRTRFWCERDVPGVVITSYARRQGRGASPLMPSSPVCTLSLATAGRRLFRVCASGASRCHIYQGAEAAPLDYVPAPRTRDGVKFSHGLVLPAMLAGHIPRRLGVHRRVRLRRVALTTNTIGVRAFAEHDTASGDATVLAIVWRPWLRLRFPRRRSLRLELHHPLHEAAQLKIEIPEFFRMRGMYPACQAGGIDRLAVRVGQRAVEVFELLEVGDAHCGYSHHLIGRIGRIDRNRHGMVQ